MQGMQLKLSGEKVHFSRRINKVRIGLQDAPYGKKLTTTRKIRYQDRWYRIYAICYSNVASHYILVQGKPLYWTGY